MKVALTKADIEEQALRLPAAERAALVESLFASLRAPGGASTLEPREMEALGDRLEAQMLEWFEGEKKELTEDVWRSIRQADPSDLDPDSWAVPPGRSQQARRS